MSSLTNIHNVEYAESYVANGNKLGVVLIANSLARTKFRESSHLRQLLSYWGRELGLDSIMVVHRSKTQAYFADVFEPWGQDTISLEGSWSTMCGNGMMAVAHFYEQYVAPMRQGQPIFINTRSGLREIRKLDLERYSVCMGEFTYNRHDLSNYVRLEHSPVHYLQQTIPRLLHVNFSDNWSIGLSGNRNKGIIDGEPHVILISDTPMSLTQLRRFAEGEGPSISKNLEIFPQEINASFAMVYETYSQQDGLRILACTHERGLGSDPVRSVTGACGTGATAIGATLYKMYALEDGALVHIAMPAGNLKVYRRHNKFYLIGSAKRM